MARDLSVRRPLYWQAPFGRHLLALRKRLAHGRLGLLDRLCRGGRAAQKVNRDPQRFDA